MTTGEAAAQIEAQLGPMWPRDRPVPKDMLAPLCEALWQEGTNPNRRIVQQHLPVVNDHAVDCFRRQPIIDTYTLITTRKRSGPEKSSESG